MKRSTQTSTISRTLLFRSRALCLATRRRVPALALREAVVRDEPFAPAAVAPQLCAGEEEDAPVGEPGAGAARAVRPGEHLQDGRTIRVQPVDPRLGGAAVVLAADAPVCFEHEIALEPRQEVVRGHRPPGEELPRHPAVLVGVREWAVREDVAEEAAVRLE